MKLNELGILHKVVCVTTDGAHNMVGARDWTSTSTPST
ncbi:unnamed protein product, partial [Adineta steineri]